MKAIKAKRLEEALKTIKESGVDYILFGNGIHLRIKNRWDFWPTTERYYDTKRKIKGCGAAELYNLVGIKTDSE